MTWSYCGVLHSGVPATPPWHGAVVTLPSWRSSCFAEAPFAACPREAVLNALREMQWRAVLHQQMLLCYNPSAKKKTIVQVILCCFWCWEPQVVQPSGACAAHHADPVRRKGYFILVIPAIVGFSCRKTTLFITSAVKQKGCSHESVLVHFQIRARPCRWSNGRCGGGASRRILHYRQLRSSRGQGICAARHGPEGPAGCAAVWFLRGPLTPSRATISRSGSVPWASGFHRTVATAPSSAAIKRRGFPSLPVQPPWDPAWLTGLYALAYSELRGTSVPTARTTPRRGSCCRLLAVLRATVRFVVLSNSGACAYCDSADACRAARGDRGYEGKLVVIRDISWTDGAGGSAAQPQLPA